ncbi:FAD-dependent oxidoreductase [Rhodobacter sp. KR11]|uniref:1-hydroxycarotenoid 3,4-desaturase CrtD n=1 Tax=Rhodobacter sp. KR11 TaxID=2974588 RepID=UPI0022222E04|nr:1-hydroxycarotenoid 3,4-desaturase CrtD [Rhodobacter sp. KR11]MCW1920214.1 FAD-dependent oxidoreductase [Rhodobacter sp. KR11]
MHTAEDQVVVVGAGFGGLAAAIRLAALGLKVSLIEAGETPGGKARAVPTPAGPAQTGPTVLTWPHLAAELFALAGQSMADQVALTALPDLARHFWPDGGQLDLTPSREANAEAIAAFAGPAEAAAFVRFDRLAEGLAKALAPPILLRARPSVLGVMAAVAQRPALWPALRPGLSLQSLLQAHFRDPRLVQLFGRYATYVGGTPALSPAVLALIWRVEAEGVHAVQGGMQALALALARAAEALGVRPLYATRASRIRIYEGRVQGVELESGRFIPATTCVFAGDPEALRQGLLGSAGRGALTGKAAKRSLSAWVWALAARPEGRALLHHNVFFTADPAAEWDPIARGEMPTQPTLYLCAQDRLPGHHPGPLERFEIIMNGPAGQAAPAAEEETCRHRTFPALQRFGLTLTPEGMPHLLTPTKLARAYPGSGGAIYGASPEATLAAFSRPGARTQVAGLYLAGGGAHPGAGVPMALLSGKHAVEVIWKDRISGSDRRPGVTPGGMSTDVRTTGRAPSR